MAIETYDTRLSARMAIADIVLNGMPSKFVVQASTHVRDGRYAMNACDYDALHYSTYDTGMISTLLLSLA